jgi:hypothetical protein
MALGALGRVDVPASGDLIALSFRRTVIAVVAAATARSQKEQRDGAGGGQESKPPPARSWVGGFAQLYVTSTSNFAIALQRIPSALSGTRSGWTLPRLSVARVARTCVPGVAFHGNSKRTRL